jgi:membrane protein DedA with SNARE-associated domain
MPATEPARPLDGGDDARRDAVFEEAVQAAAPRARTRFDRAVLRAGGWFGRHTTIRLIVALAIVTLALAQAVVLLIFDDEISDRLAGAGYVSVFITNLLSTATFYIPVPGLTAAAQAIIITEGDDAEYPWLVGIAGGLGMALGEVTAYYAGYLGAEIVRGRELPGPKRLRPTIERVVRGVRWLMDRWGMATLFVLSAVPNPLFEIAGLTAGSVRMPFRRFLLSVTGGKVVRGVLLAYLGTQLPFV